MAVNGLPAGDCDGKWHLIEPFLENFAQRSLGRWSVDSLVKAIQDQRRQVWVINNFQALCLTSVHENHVSMDAVMGERHEEWIEDLVEEIKEWSAHLGKDRIIALVRPGWARWGVKNGWKEAHREMTINLRAE
jgi:hypothetical protein